MQRKYREAAGVLEKAVGLAPREAASWFMLGLTWNKLYEPTKVALSWGERPERS
jgi:hypothetical protein